MGFFIFLAVIFFIAKVFDAMSIEQNPSGNSTDSEDEMKPLKLRLKDRKIDDDGDSFLAKEIEAKGLFPINRSVRIGFVTSVFDEVDGEFEPVISLNKSFQEPENITYQHIVEIGNVAPNQGFIKWVRVGVVIPDILQPPYGGSRKMHVYVRMINMDNPPSITHGFHEENHAGLLWQQELIFRHDFSGRGYIEAADFLDESREMAIKMAMAMAMSDGSLSDSKGEVIKKWIVNVIEQFSTEKKEKLKAR